MDAERLGFQSIAVIDRLVYDCLEPIVTLTAAAAVTTSIELHTIVLCVAWRNNPVLLAQQLGTLHQISGGRFVPGLGVGYWPDDYALSGVSMTSKRKVFDETLDILRRTWSGRLAGELSGIPALPGGEPPLLIGGFSPGIYARIARTGAGWLAPGFDREVLVRGLSAVQAEWTAAGRTGSPRVLIARYFALGDKAEAEIDRYLNGFWSNMPPEYLDGMRADMLTTDEQLATELADLAEVGCDDIFLLPCVGSPDQPQLLADALERIGVSGPNGFEVNRTPVAPVDGPPLAA